MSSWMLVRFVSAEPQQELLVPVSKSEPEEAQQERLQMQWGGEHRAPQGTGAARWRQVVRTGDQLYSSKSCKAQVSGSPKKTRVTPRKEPLTLGREGSTPFSSSQNSPEQPTPGGP